MYLHEVPQEYSLYMLISTVWHSCFLEVGGPKPNTTAVMNIYHLLQIECALSTAHGLSLKLCCGIDQRWRLGRAGMVVGISHVGLASDMAATWSESKRQPLSAEQLWLQSTGTILSSHSIRCDVQDLPEVLGHSRHLGQCDQMHMLPY